MPKVSIEAQPSGDIAPRSLRQRRKRSYSESSRDQSETPEVNIRPYVPKRTPRSLSRFIDAVSPSERSPSVQPNQTPQKRKRDDNMLSPTPSKLFKKSGNGATIKAEESSLSVSTLAYPEVSPSSSAGGSRTATLSPSGTEGQAGTDATSVDEDTIIVEHPKSDSPTTLKLERPQASEQSTADENPTTVEDSTCAEHTALPKDNILIEPSNNDSLTQKATRVNISSEVENCNLVAPVQVEGTKKRKKRGPRPSTDLDHTPSVRIPGDYVLTRELIAEPAAAWIVCKICEEPFVQKDAYFTRASCPRCERHSKLYGYRWPKIDQEGENDTDPRVLDHRTVHRFIDPLEEKLSRKRHRSATESRGVTRDASEAVAEKSEGKVTERKRTRSVRRSRFTF